jgi:pyridoxamine 5'-phosphate oxidase-like protein
MSARAVGWQAFSVDEPGLAETGRALLEQFGPGLAFLATVRADGAPRLHPVCPVLSRGGLFVLITATSPKRRDLERDGRYALQTFPQPKPCGDEFYIADTAALVEDAATRAAIFADARHRPEPSEIVFELSLERVMHTRWEHPLTPQMRPVHRSWCASRSG